MELLLAWLALSGATCLLERMGYDPAIIHPVTQEIEGDVSDGLLRSEESCSKSLQSRPERWHPL
jgi:hypothetical protein